MFSSNGATIGIVSRPSAKIDRHGRVQRRRRRCEAEGHGLAFGGTLGPPSWKTGASAPGYGQTRSTLFKFAAERDYVLCDLFGSLCDDAETWDLVRDRSLWD